MALKKVKGNLERMFDKNLTDLVRGIRNNKDNEAKYIGQCIEEIKLELRQDNINVKCNAVAKLTYIQMLGYDISWAGFNIIEVMSSSKFTCKRVGYLAASQCFHPDSELIMLTTNMIRKDLNSQSQYDAGVALSGLSCFISADLSRDLANDIITLMSSTKPYLRMKAVLMMYKVFLRYPEALRPAFPKLKEKLEDPDPGVQSAAVNVICELARKNPKNYLSLAPIFFKLMTTSTNNWMLIKIIKLFGRLTMVEPAIGKKLAKPLIEIIASTSAMSLLYECINTVIAVLISISSGMPNHSASIQLCVQKLRILIEDTDQNLKYLGLLAMSKILKTHPKSVQAHKDLILACLDDKDESIRLRALDLLYGMVSKKNLMEIVGKLLGHMERAEGSAYRDELLFKVIEICSQGSYQYVTNFEWYLIVLVELIQLESNSKHGSVIATQLLDVAIRVQAVRSFAVKEMTSMLNNFPVGSSRHSGSTMFEVMYAAAWIVGEFSVHLTDPEETLKVFLNGRPALPGHIQAVFVQNIIKLFSRLTLEKVNSEDSTSGKIKQISRLCDLMLEKLPLFISSGDIEVQERASSAFMLIEILKSIVNPENNSDFVENILEMDEDVMKVDEAQPHTLPEGVLELVAEMGNLFSGDLNPVAPKAQRKVPLPDGLDLDQWINPLPSDSESEDEDEYSTKDSNLFITNEGQDTPSGKRYSKQPTETELEQMREARKIEQSINPNYLKGTSSSSSNIMNNNSGYDGCEEIPIAEIALEIPLQIHSSKRSDKYLMNKLNNPDAVPKKSSKKVKKSKKHSKNVVNYHSSDTDGEDPKQVHVVSTTIEMPEGAELSDPDDHNVNYDPNDPHRALDIDLESPAEIVAAPAQKDSSSKNGHLKIAAVTTDSSSKKNRDGEHKKKKPKDKVKDEEQHKKEKKSKKHKESKSKDELIDVHEEKDKRDEEANKKHKKKKSKDKKEEKKDKPKSSLSVKGTVGLEDKKVKEQKLGYEEAIGISTPSKEFA